MIEFQDLYKGFDGKAVLQGLSLKIRDAETVVIIGYSGTGKSVALKHIVGLLHPDAGDVIVDGQAVSTLDRDALTALYRGYGDGIVLNGADALVVHLCRDGRVVVLEYEVFGRVVASDATYENRFVSIVTIENRKVVLWRDYMDSLAVMRALSR